MGLSETVSSVYFWPLTSFNWVQLLQIKYVSRKRSFIKRFLPNLSIFLLTLTKSFAKDSIGNVISTKNFTFWSKSIPRFRSFTLFKPLYIQKAEHKQAFVYNIYTQHASFFCDFHFSVTLWGKVFANKKEFARIIIVFWIFYWLVLLISAKK